VLVPELALGVRLHPLLSGYYRLLRTAMRLLPSDEHDRGYDTPENEANDEIVGMAPQVRKRPIPQVVGSTPTSHMSGDVHGFVDVLRLSHLYQLHRM
jgi:hypothetical protein